MDFAQAIFPHESISVTPYELELGFPAQMSYNWAEHMSEPGQAAQAPTGMAEARQYAERCHAAWKRARECLLRAQEK